jgi:tetratricopeptide (TPR) repeat protein
MYHINRRSAGDIRAGLGFFQQAIDRDSLFAQAYAGISEGYVLLAAQAALSPSEAYPRALRAALEAVRLDQRSAEAHTCFAHIAFHMADLTTARREFRLALDLEPRFAPAHHFATELFLSTDQLDSARAAIRRSLDLGPLDLAANAMLSSVLLQERRFDEAIRQLHQTLDLDSNYFLAHLALGSAYAARGDVERAAREYTIGARLTGGNRGWGALGLLYAKTGRTGDARAILDTMTRRSATLYTSPWEIARIWAALRDRENSLSWLERALDDDPWSADKVKDSPEFTILAGDPRFDRLISRAIHTASLSTASLPH